MSGQHRQMTREPSSGGIDDGSRGDQVVTRRDRPEEQTSTFMRMTLESQVAADHALRRIGALADAALEELSPLLDELYGETGRPRVPSGAAARGDAVDGAVLGPERAAVP